jgi:citronellol/citronellal dehydrogenase
MYPLADATNSQSFNGFHRAFIPEIFKDRWQNKI